MKYILFLDESGVQSLDPQKINELAPRNCMFSLGGIISESDYYFSTFNPAINKLKVKNFLSPEIILHRQKMFHAFPAVFRFLKEIRKRIKFYEDFYNLLQNLELVILVAMVDIKKFILSTWQMLYPEDVYHLCFQFIIERFYYYLQDKRGEGIIVSESRGEGRDNRLKELYKKIIQEEGTFQHSVLPSLSKGIHAEELQNYIKDLYIVYKQNNINGLQVSDLILPEPANIYTDHHPRRELLEAARKFRLTVINKLRRNPSNSNEFLGYGLKLYPPEMNDIFMRNYNKLLRGV